MRVVVDGTRDFRTFLHQRHATFWFQHEALVQDSWGNGEEGLRRYERGLENGKGNKLFACFLEEVAHENSQDGILVWCVGRDGDNESDT